jgi:dTDP-4-amino-4,6-dideoxygalactose transaminase
MPTMPFADPGASLLAAHEQISDAFAAVLRSGRYILGDEVASFEREWSQYCGVPWTVGVSSGTDALALAMRAVGVGPGDEVLVPAMTAVATWAAVSQIGAVPVGVDIEAVRNGMDPDGARAALSGRTRALVAVHLFGRIADVDGLAEVAREAEAPLVEDAAQAHGATLNGRFAGSLGAAASFSFYPTKNLGALGDAGAVTTSNPEFADRVRVLREYGWRAREDAALKGVNARLDELQAAFLRVMLPRLQRANDRRRKIAAAYLQELAGIPELELPSLVSGSEHAWHLFVVRHPRRDALAAALHDGGIGTGVHYASLPPLNAAFLDGGWREGDFPVAERHAACALSLPMHQALTEADVARVIAAVRKASRIA